MTVAAREPVAHASDLILVSIVKPRYSLKGDGSSKEVRPQEGQILSHTPKWFLSHILHTNASVN